MRAVADPTPSPLTTMFGGIDANHDGLLTSAEMKAMVGRARVNPLVANAVTDRLMDKFDTDKNGSVTNDEFRANVRNVLFFYVRDANGHRPELRDLPRVADEWVTRADTDHNNVVSVAEAKPILLAELQRDGAENAEVQADAIAKLGTYLFDRNGNRSAERQELTDLVAEIVAVTPA